MDKPALPDMFEFDRFRFPRHGSSLLRQNAAGAWKPIGVGSRALELLYVLVERRGDLVSKDEIMRAVWPGTVVEEHNLTVQISALRRILDADRVEGSCIQTVIGRGYRFLPAVTSPSIGEPRVTPVAGVAAHLSDTGPRLTLVVLPFKRLGSDPGADDLADAITDDLTTDLSRWASVITCASASVHQTGPLDVRQVGAELGVNYVVHGSVRSSTDRATVNVQLIDVGTGAHLWADRFDIEQRVTAVARDEIIGRLESGLARKLVESVNRRIDALPPHDWSAYDLYIRGRAFMLRPDSLANRLAAINYFEQALDMDPGSALARIGIANVLITNILEGWADSIEADTIRAEQLLLEALRGDTEIALAHACMGKLRRIQGRLSDSRAELEIALGMSPNLGTACSQLGMTLAFLGLPDVAIPWIEKSMRLAPHDPGTALVHAMLGLCNLMLGQIDDAITWLRKARAGNPRPYYVHMWLAAGLGLRGDLDEAGVALRQAVEIKPEICSRAALRARWQMMTASPRFFTLVENTMIVGLDRAGLPEEL
jgi:TolB-like protein/Flp pilus assembly protein TadD